MLQGEKNVPQKTKAPEEEVSNDRMSLPTHCNSLDTCGSEVNILQGKKYVAKMSKGKYFTR
jgi:hypothetical protein